MVSTMCSKIFDTRVVKIYVVRDFRQLINAFFTLMYKIYNGASVTFKDARITKLLVL